MLQNKDQEMAARELKLRLRHLASLVMGSLLCFFSAAVSAQTARPRVGDQAPELKVKMIMQAPSQDAARMNQSGLWEPLRGKVVVVEFWATWCSPCMPALTHLNQLAEKFKDQPVQFIAITDEDEATITQFLKQKPIRGWVGLDTERTTLKVYQPGVIPHTVIIGRDGKIAAITEPMNVSAEAISDLLAGKPISLPLKDSVTADLAWDKKTDTKTETKAEAKPEAEPLFQILIKPSQAASGGTSVAPEKITGDGMVFSNFITTAYQTPYFRIINRVPESKETYKVSVIVPKGREEMLYPVFQHAVEAFFGVRTRREKQEVDVFVLRVPEGKTSSLRPSQAAKETRSFGRGKIHAEKQPLTVLAQTLENFLGRPVVDETKVSGEYDWELPYNYADKSLLLNALRDQLGLEVVPAKRTIEMLVVEKAEPVKRH